MSTAMFKTVLTDALHKQMSIDGWLAEVEARAEKIALFRAYQDGDHRANLTPEMKALLRVSDGTLTELNGNYIDLIVQTMGDRASVSAIEADNNLANKWIAWVLEENYFDAMQAEVHEDTIRDGDSFIIVDWDNERQVPRLNHEPAFDGVEGVTVVYQGNDIVAAVKVWQYIAGEGTTVRINVYLPGEIRKYQSRNGATSNLEELGKATWTMRDGLPLGVPVVRRLLIRWCDA